MSLGVSEGSSKMFRFAAASVTAVFLVCGFIGHSQADEIADRARNCWNLLPSDFGLGGNVEMVVSTKGSLVTNIAVSSYWPDDARGYAVAEAAAKAVQQCAPYSVADGDHQVMMNVLSDNEASTPVTIPKPGQQ